MTGFVVSTGAGHRMRRVPVASPGTVDRIRDRSGDPDGALERWDAGEAARRVLYRTAAGATLRAHVRERDGDCCRMCAVAVVWADRRSPVGGTFHVLDLARPVSATNVVVACRRCNMLAGIQPAQQPAPTLLRRARWQRRLVAARRVLRAVIWHGR